MPQCSGAFADEGFITQELLLYGFSLLANSVILVLLCSVFCWVKSGR